MGIDRDRGGAHVLSRLPHPSASPDSNSIAPPFTQQVRQLLAAEPQLKLTTALDVQLLVVGDGEHAPEPSGLPPDPHGSAPPPQL